MNNFLNWLNKNMTKPHKIPTLGGRASITVQWQPNGKVLTVNRQVKDASVEILEQVLSRYKNADTNKRNTTIYFGIGWKECPDQFLCPYVASVISEYMRS